MKRSVILFLTILLTKIISFSQTTSIPIEKDSILISTEELKITNLIFIEHESLLKEKELMDKQFQNYMKKTDVLQNQIKLISEEKDFFKYIVDTQTMQIEKLQKDLNKKNRVIKSITIGGVTVTVGLILFLIFK